MIYHLSDSFIITLLAIIRHYIISCLHIITQLLLMLHTEHIHYYLLLRHPLLRHPLFFIIIITCYTHTLLLYYYAVVVHIIFIWYISLRHGATRPYYAIMPLIFFMLKPATYILLLLFIIIYTYMLHLTIAYIQLPYCCQLLPYTGYYMVTYILTTILHAIIIHYMAIINIYDIICLHPYIHICYICSMLLPWLHIYSYIYT